MGRRPQFLDYSVWILVKQSLSIHRFIVLFELKILSRKINILNIWRLESSLVKYSRVLALVFLDPFWSDLKMNLRIRILLI